MAATGSEAKSKEAQSIEAQSIEALSFEEALAELERIVATLEKGQAGLEDSIAVYERGTALKAHCEAKLKSAQAKIERIVVGAGGMPAAQPFDAE